MSQGNLCLRPQATMQIAYGDPDAGCPYAVDCRMLFLGNQLDDLVPVYEEVVRLFSAGPDPDTVFQRLQSSPAVRRFYEAGRENGKVWAQLRDPVFWEAQPTDDLDVRLKASGGNHPLIYPVPPRRWKALGCLWPLLYGDHGLGEIQATFRARLAPEDAEWANALVLKLQEHGLLEEGKSPRPNALLKSPARPRVTFLGHTSLLLQSEQTALLLDPLFPFPGMSARAREVPRLKIGAIGLTHSHWDHCHPQTLLSFDKDTPVLIPRVGRPSAFNPPMANMLHQMGFTDIREVELFKPVRVHDIEFVPLPFHGEQDEPDAEIDHYTYVLKTQGLTLYGGVDCFHDTFGEMKPVLEEVRRQYAPDVAFLPASAMVFAYKHGGVNGFCRYLDGSRLGQSFQYTAGPEQAAEWAATLGARLVAPYALFTFARWDAPKEIGRFRRALRARGLDRRLYPLRPFDSLEPADWRGSVSSTLRRRLLLVWFEWGPLGRRLARGLRRRLGRILGRKRPGAGQTAPHHH